MKRKIVAVLTLLCIALSVALVGAGCVEEQNDPPETQEYEITFSSGTGYTVAVDSLTLTNGKATVKAGTVVTFAVNLAADYNQSNITVKANDIALTPSAGKYSITVNATTAIKVSGVTENTQNPPETQKYEIAFPSGTGYTVAVDSLTLTNGKATVNAGTVVAFAVNLNDDYNQSNITVKANDVVLTPSAGGGTYSVTVNAATVITVSGVEKNPQGETLAYKAIGRVLTRAADSESTTDLGGTDTSKSEVHRVTAAGAVAWNNIALAPYKAVKFYIKAQSGWLNMLDNAGIFNDKTSTGGDQQIFASAAASENIWYELEFKKETDETETYWQMYVNGVKHEKLDANTPVNAKLSKRLSEMKFFFDQGGVYMVSELLGAEDPDYVAPTIAYEALFDSPFTQTADDISSEYPDDDIVENSSVFTTAWGYNNLTFQAVNMGKYNSLKFYVKASESTYFGLAAGSGNDYFEKEVSSSWIAVEFVCEDGEWTINYNGVAAKTGLSVGDLSKIVVKSSATTYCFSDLLASENPDYVEATVTAPSGTGYSVELMNAFAENGTGKIGRGAELKFRVVPQSGYTASDAVVKVNGTAVTAQNGVYAVEVTGDIAISVEGVTENSMQAVSTLEELRAMKEDGKYYLANDIDCASAPFTATGAYIAAGKFGGVLDGRGHSIKNLTFQDNDKQSFFGEFYGTLTDIKFENVSFNGWGADGAKQTEGAAVIAYMMLGGKIENVDISVAFNAKGKTLSKDTDYKDGINLNSATVVFFLQGEMKDICITMTSLSNSSAVDGAVAIGINAWPMDNNHNNYWGKDATATNVSVTASTDIWLTVTAAWNKPVTLTDCTITAPPAQ